MVWTTPASVARVARQGGDAVRDPATGAALATPMAASPLPYLPPGQPPLFGHAASLRIMEIIPQSMDFRAQREIRE